MKKMLAAGFCLLLAGKAMAAETVLFEEKFETDTSGSWTVIGDSPTDTPDHTAQFAFDYSTQKYVANGVTNSIPPAPNSLPGETKGVKFAVNNGDATAEAAGVSAYPTGKTFTGNYALRADVWMNYPGVAYGEQSSGSTEFSTFGINHLGTQANWHSTETIGDGVWFAMAGEGGAIEDFRSYEWDGFSVQFLRGAAGGLVAEDHGSFLNYFPAPFYESPGAPGKQWAQVEVLQRDGLIVWKVDGFVIAERPNSAPATEGNIMIGAMDVFASIASPAADSFVIFDNVRVVQLDETILPTVSITATDANAAEPGSDTALLTVARTGDTAEALEVRLRVYGTAESGVDFMALSNSVTIPAGQSTVDITVTALDDPKAEPEETIIVGIAPSSQYEQRSDVAATVTLADDGDVAAISLVAVNPWAYEGVASNPAVFRVNRVGDASGALTVNLAVAGTAQAGTDYQAIGSTVQFDAGVDSALVRIVPVDNSATDGDRTVTVELRPGTGYTLGATTNVTATIRDDDGLSAGTVVFSDDFDTDTTAQWAVNMAHADFSRATFNFDYSSVGIPQAPNTTNGTTSGLKLEANIGAATFTGLSVSPIGQGFGGDYRLSFDMWINFPGPLAAGGVGSTMMFSAGVGTAGTLPQFPGSSVEGVLFSVTGDGGTTADYRAYAATGAPIAADTGVYAAGTAAAATSNANSYYAPFGRVSAPEAQLAIFPDQTGLTAAGAPGIAWHEVAVEKRGTNISWYIDTLRIATVALTNREISTNIFVGFFDINTGQPAVQDMSFGLVDNLRVEALASLPAGELKVTSIRRDGQNIVIDFTIPSNLTAFGIEGSGTVEGGYAAEAAAQITTVSAMERRATIPLGSGNRFFRVRGQ